MNFLKFLFGWYARELMLCCFKFAVINRSSTQIANRDASPQLLNDPGSSGGFVRQLFATILSVTGDSATSIYRFFQIPSNAVISSLLLWAADQGAGAVMDIGIWQTTANGGVAVTDNLFANNIDMHTTPPVKVEERFNALALNTAGQQLWQLLGLSADPAINYDLGMVVDVAVAAGGSIVLLCEYSQ